MKTEDTFEYQYNRYEAIILQGNVWDENGMTITFPIVLHRDIEAIEAVCKKYELSVKIINVDGYMGKATIRYNYTSSSLIAELLEK